MQISSIYAIKRLIYVSLLQYKDTAGVYINIMYSIDNVPLPMDRMRATIIAFDLNEIVY